MLRIKALQCVILLLLLVSMFYTSQAVFSVQQAEAQEFLTLTPGKEASGEFSSNRAREYVLEDPQLSDIPELISYALKFMLSLSGVGAVFFIFYGAFMYVSGFTIEEKKKGKTQILFAILGLSLIIGSYALTETLVKVMF